MGVFGKVSLEDSYFGSGEVVTTTGRVVQVSAFSVFVAAHSLYEVCLGLVAVYWQYIAERQIQEL